MCWRKRFAALILLFAPLLTAPLFAQTVGEITGQIVDPTGAVIAGAQVTAVNEETNVSRQTGTNASGLYSFPALLPGQYRIRVEMPGFQPVVRRSITLQVQQTSRIDIQMTLGQSSQAIEVDESAPLLTTENASTGTVIENKRIVELPLNGRNFLQLVSLSPNVAANFANSSFAVARQGGQRAQQNISVSGARSEFNHFTLDGVENTDPNFNTYVFLPSIDALQEFKVQTGIYPAEFGWNASQVNVSTKSGTNQYHGTAFEFLRNSLLDANNYSFTPARTAKDPYKRNQYGFTLGGPIVIPKVFSGKDRLFFMANFEGVRDRKGIREYASLPTAAMRAGDFSSLLPKTAIFDAATRVQSGSIVTAQPFPNNMIPASRLDPRAVKLLPYYGLPNVAGAGLSTNYQATESQSIDNDQFSTRIDYAENTKSTWFGRWSWGDESQLSPATLPKQGTFLKTQVQQAMISNTRIFGPSTVNEFRFGYNRFINSNLQYSAFKNNVLGDIGGIGGVATPAPLIYGLPAIGITGFTGFGENGDAPYINHNNGFQWSDSVSLVRGTHTLRAGADIRRLRYNQTGNSYTRGTFTFTGFATQNPAAPANTGYGMADYMLGQVQSSAAALGLVGAQLRATSQGYYVADTWKIRPNLTIDLGLRYEYSPPYTDKHNNLINAAIPSMLDPNQHPTLVRAGTGDFYESIPFRYAPTVQIARDGRLPNSLVYNDTNDFAPRIGIAYSPTHRWTLRTGFGMFYAHDIGNARFDLARNLQARRQETALNNFPNLTLALPFSNLGTTVVATPQILADQVNRHTPYIFQYLVNVQRQITDDTLLEVGYTGNGGRKMERWWPFNIPAAGPGAVNARRAYPELGLIQVVAGVANSEYNSATVKMTQRFAHGVTYLVSYTYSHAIDGSSGIRQHSNDIDFPQDPYNLRAERASSTFDQRHRLVTSLLWDVPVGKGKQWLDHGGLVDAVVGGWAVGSIVTALSGLPFTVLGGLDVANNGWAGTQRPSYSGQSLTPAGGPSPQLWFNPAAFALPASFTFGNVGRNTMNGPRLFEWDFSAMKRFHIIERHELEFRFEAFNIPNHPNFGVPHATFTDPAFGRITNTANDMRQIQFALKYIF